MKDFGQLKNQIIRSQVNVTNVNSLIMKNFEHLDTNTIEIAGLSASIAGGCRPCLDYQLKKGLRAWMHYRPNKRGH